MKLSLNQHEIHALAWIAEKHPNCGIELTPHLDRAGVGWLLVRVTGIRMRGTTTRAQRCYVTSPTGRVWSADPIAPTVRMRELRDACYVEVVA